MITIDPETRAKFAKFRKNKIAWRSLLLLTFFFIASLPAEFLFNDRPILLGIDGEWYSPVLFSYTYKDFGGEVDAPVLDYNSEAFKHFMSGDTLEVNLDVLYPDSPALDPDTPEGKEASLPDGPLISYRKGSSRETFAINPPFKHSYSSFYTSNLLDRQVLVSPFATVRDGKDVPGGGEESHWIGTDKTGKDVLARLVYGFRL